MKAIKVGDKFTRVKVEIDALMNVVDVKKERLTVLGVSKYFAVLNDDCFEKLSLNETFSRCYSKPEKVSIHESKSDFDIKYFGKFRISIYSQMSDKRIENKINREFKKWIDKKLGAYGYARTINIKINEVKS